MAAFHALALQTGEYTLLNTACTFYRDHFCHVLNSVCACAGWRRVLCCLVAQDPAAVSCSVLVRI